MYVSCEARLLAWVAEHDAECARAALRAHALGGRAARIGTVEPAEAGGAAVVPRTPYGALRPLDVLAGVNLPRS